MTTFDRYLLSRYLHVVAVFFIAAIGLYAVVDGFINLDEFQPESGTAQMLGRMGKHYLFQSAAIVDLAGPTIMVLAAMCALALLLKSGEIHPVLAAGVPTYRLTVSLLVGMLVMNGLLIVNQECLLPRIAPYLQGARGATGKPSQRISPQVDPKWKIYVAAGGVVPAKQMLINPEFTLPAPALVSDFFTLRAEEAVFLPSHQRSRSGWLLRNVEAPLDRIPLTPAGEDLIVPQPNGQDVFVASTLTIDQMIRQAGNLRLVSTPELFQRLQQSAGSLPARRRQLIHLHSRMTRPLLTVLGLYLTIPLIIRREKMSAMQQVTNIAVCSTVLGAVFGLAMGTQYLGETGLMNPEQSVWAPLVAGGGLAAWLTGIVRT